MMEVVFGQKLSLFTAEWLNISNLRDWFNSHFEFENKKEIQSLLSTIKKHEITNDIDLYFIALLYMHMYAEKIISDHEYVDLYHNILSINDCIEVNHLYKKLMINYSENLLGFCKEDVIFSINSLKNVLDDKLSKLHMMGPKNEKDHVERIVIVSGYMLPKSTNTHVLFFKRIAKAIRLVSPDTEIYLAITGEKSSKNTILGNCYNYMDSQEYRSFWTEIIEGDEYVYCGNEYGKDIRLFFDWINQIRPACIIAHGEGYPEANFSINKLYEKYPIVYVPTSVKNIPKCNVDMIVMFNKESRKYLDSHYDLVKNEKVPLIYETGYPLSILDMDSQKYPINLIDYGINEGDIVFGIFVGRNLITKAFLTFTNEEIDLFCSLFDGLSTLKMIFVGDTNFDAVRLRWDKINILCESKRIILLDRIDNNLFDSFVESIDLVFSLSGITGGGGAMQSAYMRKVACIAPYESDGSRYVDEMNKFNTTTEMIDMLRELASNQLKRVYNVEHNVKKVISSSGSMEVFEKFVDGLCKSISHKRYDLKSIDV